MSVEWFASRLKELREARGLTQPQLAEMAGMNRFGVAKLEQGVTKPTWETVLALCQALGVDCTSFAQEPAERPPVGPGRPRKAREAEGPSVEPPAPQKGRGKRKKGQGGG